MRKIALLAPLILTACGGTVYKDRIQTVNVPVSVPCVAEEGRPVEVVPLNQTMTREQWDALTLDQREKLLLAQAAARKAYGEQLFVVTAGCP